MSRGAELMRVALVHDWLTGMRGGERVLESLIALYPNCEIFTLLHVPGSVSAAIERRPIHTSPLQRLPGASTRYRNYLPLFPAAVSRLDLSGFDLVISVSHAVAKSVRVPKLVPHVCYCLTPMRYVWDRYDDYFAMGRAGWPTRAAMSVLAPMLRTWDRRTARGVTRFVAISRHVQERIRRAYQRESQVVYPPVALSRFSNTGRREAFYLAVSALAPSKRLDLAVSAFTRMGKPLVVIGDGPERRRVEWLAGPTVRFLGAVDDATVADHYARCRALVIPGVEDFGLTAVEAQASGAPVIAYGEGGVVESVIGVNGTQPAGATGVFFHEQTISSLQAAVERFEGIQFDERALTTSAARFSEERFAREFRAQVEVTG